jgi:hypothetical protein
VKARAKRAAKPRKSFPLFVHGGTRWCKKVLGRHVYFGSVKKDPEGVAALARWLEQKDFLLNGIEPPADTDGLTVDAVARHDHSMGIPSSRNGIG